MDFLHREMTSLVCDKGRREDTRKDSQQSGAQLKEYSFMYLHVYSAPKHRQFLFYNLDKKHLANNKVYDIVFFFFFFGDSHFESSSMYLLLICQNPLLALIRELKFCLSQLI